MKPEPDKNTRRYFDSFKNIDTQLSEFIMTGVHTKQELIDFCISKGMKEIHASEFIENILRRLRTL